MLDGGGGVSGKKLHSCIDVLGLLWASKGLLLALKNDAPNSVLLLFNCARPAANAKTMLYRTTFHDGDHSNSQGLQTTEAASSVAMSDV